MAALLTAALGWSGAARAQDPQSPAAATSAAPGVNASSTTTASEVEALRREVEELRAHQHLLEKRLQAQTVPPPPIQLQPGREPPPPPTPDAVGPRFHFGRDGFAFGTADGQNEVRFHFVFHFDGHAYFGDHPPAPDSLFIRRARPFIDGTVFGILDFRFMPELAPGQPTVLDTYVELHPRRWLRIRAGHFRSPIGLEYLERDSGLALVERSLVTDLVPFRDTGVMLLGDVGGGTFEYQLAVTNGAPDMGNADLSVQTAKDYVGRLFVRPFKSIKRLEWCDLGFGMAGSYGTPWGTSNATQLPVYKSTSLVTMFTYAAAVAAVPTAGTTAVPATIADGTRWRLAPQAEWYAGPFAVLGEWVRSSQKVKRGDDVQMLDHQAWNVTLRFVLTMERASADHIVVENPVDFRHARFGAWELAARYSELRMDARAFPLFADPNASVRGARELGVGLNWHLTQYTKLMVSYERSDFTGGGAMGSNRPAENALLARLLLAI